MLLELLSIKIVSSLLNYGYTSVSQDQRHWCRCHVEAYNADGHTIHFCNRTITLHGADCVPNELFFCNPIFSYVPSIFIIRCRNTIAPLDNHFSSVEWIKVIIRLGNCNMMSVSCMVLCGYGSGDKSSQVNSSLCPLLFAFTDATSTNAVNIHRSIAVALTVCGKVTYVFLEIVILCTYILY